MEKIIQDLLSEIHETNHKAVNLTALLHWALNGGKVLISEMELSVRTVSALKSVGITTIKDLLLMSEVNLIKIPNFGRKSLNEVNELLASLGMSIYRRQRLE